MKNRTSEKRGLSSSGRITRPHDFISCSMMLNVMLKLVALFYIAATAPFLEKRVEPPPAFIHAFPFNMKSK